jgi:hypothetical protein
MPTGLLFRKHIEEDEALLHVVHKHWLVGLKALFWPSLVFMLFWGLLYFVQTKALFLIVASISVGVGVWWLRNFFDYYLDAWLVTNHGVIDIAWHGWFHRESTRVLYSDIQGVGYEIKGVIPTLLRYGTISVEKMSTGNTIALDHVYNPRRIEAMILRNAETYLQAKNLKDAEHVKELLSALVAQHVQLQGLPSSATED